MSAPQTAIVIGATGLVGRQVVTQLLASSSFERVVALVRRPSGVNHPKYDEHLIDFSKPESFAALVKGDVLFSALGTTRGEAGSVEAQRVVDYTYQLDVARLAAKQGVRACVIVSSTGADPNSAFAYMKMKGELERDVKTLGFAALHLMQPGPLRGEREKPRFLEGLNAGVLGAFSSLLPSRLRPIDADIVARAMLRVASQAGTFTHSAAELFELGRR